MTVILNGESKPFDAESLPLIELLESLGFEARPVLVEHNGTALHPRSFAETTLRDGDRLEIIQIVAGG